MPVIMNQPLPEGHPLKRGVIIQFPRPKNSRLPDDIEIAAFTAYEAAIRSLTYVDDSSTHSKFNPDDENS